MFSHAAAIKTGTTNGENSTPGGVLSWFDEWVARDPNKLAIRFQDEELSYGELDQRSRQLAMRLRDHGVGLESIIPFCLPKSIHAVVSMLAILRCGAAFAAILPSSPAPRKRDVISACRSEVILCGIEQKHLVEGLCPAQIVICDEVRGDLGNLEKNSKDPDSFPIPTSSHVACVLFTSGSTGGMSLCSLRAKTLESIRSGLPSKQPQEFIFACLLAVFLLFEWRD